MLKSLTEIWGIGHGVKTAMAVVDFFDETLGYKMERAERSYQARRLATNELCLSRMRPDEDRTTGYFVPDTASSSHIIIPVNLKKLKEEKRTPEGRKAEFDVARLKMCSRTHADNNHLMEMPHVAVDRDNNIRLIEGNHCLEVLGNNSQQDILVYVSLSDYNLPEDMHAAAELIFQKCGSEDANIIRQNGDYNYCLIDYHEQTRRPYIYTPHYTGPYYEVG